MFQAVSYVKLNESNPGCLDKVSDNLIKNNSNKQSGVSKVITGVANNNENKRDQVIHFSDTETEDISSKKSVLKYVIGGVLAGIGVLAVWGGYNLVTGRQNTGNRSEKMSLNHFSDVPAPPDSVLWDGGGGALTTAGNTLISGVNSTVTPETSLSPYSYYEKIYGGRETQNQTRQLASASTTAEEPDITTNSSTSAYMTDRVTSDGNIKWYDHDNVRFNLYRTLMDNNKQPQPLGPIFHEKISVFCNSKYIKSAIEQALTGDSKQKCALLNSLSDRIEGVTLDENVIIDEHDGQSKLTKREYIEELIIKRKITTLLMAAESIMGNKNFDEFYIEAMKDYKPHSTDEIDYRQSVIWDYLSENECLDDYDSIFD